MTYGNYGSQLGGPAPQSPAFPADGFNPMQLLRRAASRKSLLFKVAGAVFIVLAVIVFVLPATYLATAQIVIEAPQGPTANATDQPAAPVADREKIMSEVQVLMSRGIADKVIRDLKLGNRAEFNSSLDTSPLGYFNRALGAKGTPAGVVDKYYGRLNVYQVGTSRVIAVEFTSHDPVLARDVANRVVDLYIEQQRQARLDANARARGWLSQQIDDLRKRVADSEEKVETYRSQKGLLEGAGGQLQSQQLTELNTQLSTAHAARTEAEARVANLERAVAPDGTADASADSALEVLQSPLIQQLRQQEVQLKRDISEMSAQLLPTHPKMVQKQAELSNLEQQIRAEVQKVLESVRNEARVAASREGGLQRQLDQMEGRRAVSDQSEVELRALERDANANRTVLESFLSRYTEVSTRGDISIQEANARTISRAEMPGSPNFPKKGPMLMLAAFAALAAGLAAVFVAELTNRNVRYAGDVENAAGVKVFASLPAIGSLPQDEALYRPDGPFAEGIRSLQARLGIRPARNSRGRVVLVSSTARAEGRTTTALALARFMSQGGLRVLLIDADFERPMLSHMLGMALHWGFIDLASGRVAYRDVIVRDPLSRVHVIATGRGNAATAMTSPRFPAIMYGLVRSYDAIVLDAPPVSSSDAHWLAQLADQCVYAVRWDATERDRVVAGVRRLATSGLRGGIGLVLTRTEEAALA